MYFIKSHLKVHLKYWYMYLLIAVAIIPGYTISLMFA